MPDPEESTPRFPNSDGTNDVSDRLCSEDPGILPATHFVCDPPGMEAILHWTQPTDVLTPVTLPSVLPRNFRLQQRV